MLCLFREHFGMCLKWRAWFLWPKGNKCCKLPCPCVSLPLTLPSYCFLSAFSTLCVPHPHSHSVECPLMLFINDGAEIQSCSHPSSPPQLAVGKHNQPHCSHSALAQARHFLEMFMCPHRHKQAFFYTFPVCARTHGYYWQVKLHRCPPPYLRWFDYFIFHSRFILVNNKMR